MSALKVVLISALAVVQSHKDSRTTLTGDACPVLFLTTARSMVNMFIFTTANRKCVWCDVDVLSFLGGI